MLINTLNFPLSRDREFHFCHFEYHVNLLLHNIFPFHIINFKHLYMSKNIKCNNLLNSLATLFENTQIYLRTFH